MRIRHFVRAATAVAAIALSGIPAAAAPSTCNVPTHLRLERPDPNGTPTPVEVGVFVLDVPLIDERAGTFDLDMFAVLRWRDPRLSEEQLGYSLKGCRVQMFDVWHPDIRIINRTESKVDALWLEIDADGNVQWAQRASAKLRTVFDLRQFPFDKQRLPIELVSFSYGPDDINIAMLPMTGRRETLSLSGWNVGEVTTSIRTEHIPSLNEDFARTDVVLPITRIPSYYIWKIILPLTLIVCMAWTVFWLDPASLGPQIGVSTASVFTLVAFLMSLGQLLPPEAYLTRLDKFVLGCTVMVFLALGEAIATSRLAATDRHALSLRVDAVARSLYFVMFALMAFVTLRM